MGFSRKSNPLRIVEFPGGIKSQNSKIPGGLRLRIVEFPKGMEKQGRNSIGLTHNNMKFHWGKTKNRKIVEFPQGMGIIKVEISKGSNL